MTNLEELIQKYKNGQITYGEYRSAFLSPSSRYIIEDSYRVYLYEFSQDSTCGEDHGITMYSLGNLEALLPFNYLGA